LIGPRYFVDHTSLNIPAGLKEAEPMGGCKDLDVVRRKPDTKLDLGHHSSGRGEVELAVLL